MGGDWFSDKVMLDNRIRRAKISCMTQVQISDKKETFCILVLGLNNVSVELLSPRAQYCPMTLHERTNRGLLLSCSY